MIPRSLSPGLLEVLAGLLEQGRLAVPFTVAALRRHAPAGLRGDAVTALRGLVEAGLSGQQAAATLRLVALERREVQRAVDCTELVWSGPEGAQSASRDTGVVVRELFRQARRSVVLANYAFDSPWSAEARERARALFAPLATNMDATAGLQVRFFVNVARPNRGRAGADDAAEVLLRGFASRFLKNLWPGQRQPEIFYDPRALQAWVEGQTRASLHAKCLVVDDQQVLLTSANFTEAAQVRNIEAGVLLDNPFVARSLREQFESLVRGGVLLRVPGVG